MGKMNVVLAFATATLALSGCSSRKAEKTVASAPPGNEVMAKDISHESVGRLIQDWPLASKNAANGIITKHGLPQEVTPSMLRWSESAPFKRTTVFRQEVAHNFPLPHTDVLEQVINYDVPTHKVDDLNQLDGSLSVDRTRGELLSRCDREEMNTLAFNLADKVIRGGMTVDEARREFTRSSQEWAMGNVNQYTTALDFRPDSETADADMAVIQKTPGARGGLREHEVIQAEEARGSLESDNMEE